MSNSNIGRTYIGIFYSRLILMVTGNPSNDIPGDRYTHLPSYINYLQIIYERTKYTVVTAIYCSVLEIIY